jgi:acyl-CoA synthetase (AMP-forming)/AMP-acid ligase II
LTNYYTILRENLHKLSSKAISFGLGEDQQLTYQELRKRVDHFRQILRSNRLQKDTAVILGIPFSLDAIAAFLAVMAEGHTATFLPAKDRLHTIRSISRLGFKKAILLDRQPGLLKRLFFKIFGIKVLIDRAQTEPLAHLPAGSMNEIALLSFSSGSTGKPKPILRSHRVLTHQQQAISDVYPEVKEQTDMPLFPNLILHNLTTGAHTVFPDNIEGSLSALRIPALIEQIKSHKVNTLTGNVYYFFKLLEHCKHQDLRLDTLKEVGIGGSPVPEHLLRELRWLFPSAELHILYGSTEAEPIAHRIYQEPHDPLYGYFAGDFHPSVTYSFINKQVIRSANGKSVEAGDLIVKGPHVIKGEKEWFATGDIGYLSDQGLFLTARKGNEKTCGGFQHYQLEHYLWKDEQIDRVAVISHKDGFRIHYTGRATKLNIRQSLQNVISLDCIHSIVKTDSLPYDSRHLSKILYHKLK